MPERASQAKFEVSPEAAAVIRQRGGQLWIWPGPDRSAYATTEPPGETHKWTASRQAGFVVNVDDAIVPPQRWIVGLPDNEGRHLDARWNGADPHETFERLPLVDPAVEPTPTDRTVLQRVCEGFACFGLVSLVTWALQASGIRGGQLPEEVAVGILAGLLVIVAYWAWRWVRRIGASLPRRGRG